jgi:hypothetical protein
MVVDTEHARIGNACVRRMLECCRTPQPCAACGEQLRVGVRYDGSGAAWRYLAFPSQPQVLFIESAIGGGHGEI